MTFTEIILDQKEPFEIDLCCWTVNVTPVGNGVFRVDKESHDFILPQLQQYLRYHNCWADSNKTEQYLELFGVSYSMKWLFDAYMGTMPV